jgi:type II secretory pathway component PulC
VDDLQVKGMKALRALLPFFIISVLCVGGVELFYRLALHALFRPLLASSEGTGNARPGPGDGKMEKPHNYQVILDRNLFGSGPQSGNTINPLAGLSATSLDFILLGTVAGENGDKRAVIMDRESKKQAIYHVGDTIQGAVIKDILRGKVVLGFRGRDEILDMTEARQYFAETAAMPPMPQEQQEILSVPVEIQQARPVGKDTLLVPPRRKFSIDSGSK